MFNSKRIFTLTERERKREEKNAKSETTSMQCIFLLSFLDIENRIDENDGLIIHHSVVSFIFKNGQEKSTRSNQRKIIQIE